METISLKSKTKLILIPKSVSYLSFLNFTNVLLVYY